MLSKSYLIPVMLTLTFTACVNTPPIDAVKSDSLIQQIVLPYSFRNKAFDGNALWSVVKTNESHLVIKQNLSGKVLSEIPLSEATPPHRSLAWGKGQLWLLDLDNTLYPISTNGKTQTALKLTELPESAIAEQIVWLDQALWVLTSAYLLADGSLAPSGLYQVDPETGKLLKTLKLQANEALKQSPRKHFDSFSHQNLSADTQYFYVARANIFEKEQNAIYRIEQNTGLISVQALERVYTGLNSLFWWKNQLFGIELIDSSNCGDYCRGKLEKLSD